MLGWVEEVSRDGRQFREVRRWWVRQGEVLWQTVCVQEDWVYSASIDPSGQE